MIAYRGQAPGLPSWLLGLEDHPELRHTQRSDGHLVAVCPGWQALPPAEGEWIDCGEGWACSLGITWTAPPLRSQARLRTIPAQDGQARSWAAPCVLQPFPLDGLSFDVPLGPGWQPLPDAGQAVLIGAARWARQAVLAGLECDPDRELFEDVPITLPLDRAAAATADLLCAVHHVSPAVLAALRLIDRGLIQAVLLAAAGLHVAMLRKLASEAGHGH